MDVKSVLKHVKLTEASKLFDVGIGVYLLNPLKSSYTFDDVAKEYLDGKLLPTREDLLGKETFRTAWEKSLEGLGTYACYVAYTVLASRVPIEKALHETGNVEGLYRNGTPAGIHPGFHGEMGNLCQRRGTEELR